MTKGITALYLYLLRLPFTFTYKNWFIDFYKNSKLTNKINSKLVKVFSIYFYFSYAVKRKFSVYGLVHKLFPQ